MFTSKSTKLSTYLRWLDGVRNRSFGERRRNGIIDVRRGLQDQAAMRNVERQDEAPQNLHANSRRIPGGSPHVTYAIRSNFDSREDSRVVDIRFAKADAL